MKQKFKFIYDIKSGHFIKKLNEDDSNALQTDSNNTTETNNTETNKDNTSKHKSVESDEVIQSLNNKKTDLEKRFQTDLSIQKKLLDLAKETAANTKSNNVYNPVDTDNNVLTILKKINTMTKQHAIDLANIEDQRLVQLQKLSQVKESAFTNLPEKYRDLNESNLHQAKIYMKNLVVNDENHILKGMADFKRAFKDTNLLYGKDKQGYFVIALDNDDLSAAFDTLEEVGYLRDEIIDTFLPQALDKTKMIF